MPDAESTWATKPGVSRLCVPRMLQASRVTLKMMIKCTLHDHEQLNMDVHTKTPDASRVTRDPKEKMTIMNIK